MLEELSTAQKVVGVKQSLRALREGRARKVFLACDADPTVTGRVEDACASVPVERDFTMAQLGSAALSSAAATQAWASVGASALNTMANMASHAAIRR